MAENLNQFDLLLKRRSMGRLTSNRETVDLQGISGDMGTATGRANLAQAILNRLYTRRGELAQLGHPDYGSRLHQLIGELNNTRTRNLAELYIRECLAQELRIAEITQIVFEPPSRRFDKINSLVATIAVKPVGEQTDLTLTISLNLEG